MFIEIYCVSLHHRNLNEREMGDSLLTTRNNRMKIQSYKDDLEGLNSMRQTAKMLNNISKEGMDCMLDDIDFQISFTQCVLDKLIVK